MESDERQRVERFKDRVAEGLARAVADAQPRGDKRKRHDKQGAGKRKRHDKEGFVVFPKDSTGMLEWPPRAEVVRGKEMRLPPRPGASPRYVKVSSLYGPPDLVWWRHIDDVEPLPEAAPRLFKMYEERKDVRLLALLVQAVATCPRPEDVWANFAPNMSFAEARALAGEC